MTLSIDDVEFWRKVASDRDEVIEKQSKQIDSLIRSLELVTEFQGILTREMERNENG